MADFPAFLANCQVVGYAAFQEVLGSKVGSSFRSAWLLFIQQ